MRKITVEVVVDADRDVDVFDGLNEGFRQLNDEHGWVLDWAYRGNPGVVQGDAATYVEGQAFHAEPGSEIAFHTGYLMGYLWKKDIEALPVMDDDGNYEPFIDITVPVNTANPDAGSKVIRVQVVEVRV